jgi:hypothetical protein
VLRRSWQFRVLAIASVLVGALAVPAARAVAPPGKGPVTATVNGATAVLGDARVRREWRILPGPTGGIVTSALVDGNKGQSWAGPASTDFSITVDGVPLTSAGSWEVLEASARDVGHDAGQVVFRLGTPAMSALGAGLEIDRTYTLHAGSATIEVASTLVNRTPAPVRIGAYTLDELTGVAGQAPSTEVQAYNGGSDWRDDYRHVSTPAGSFDVEGQVLRTDSGAGAGAFIVGERRGGAMNRVGRDASAGRVWAGVDNARDLLDAGPILTDPPNYNRVENPAYPVPVRQRTVLPLGSLELGRAHTGVYRGGAQEAAANFVTDFAANVAPQYPRTVGLNSFHPWSHGPDFNATTMLAQARAGRALGLESIMLDDQWQGGPGGESGDWRFDTVRFPDSNGDGTPDFVDQLHALGMRLGLWMSPVEFNTASETYKQHPDWACAPTGDLTAQIPDDAGLGVWDVTNPSFRAFLTSVIDREVAQWGVKEFKFDFQVWVDCPPHDYLDYEDAFVSLVRSFEARHPDVTFELDETNDQRAWAFESAALGPSWFDNGHLHGSAAVPKLLHDVWSAAPWLPPSSIGMGLYDGTLQAPYTPAYLMPLALLSHVTFWTDLTTLSSSDAAETAWWTGWYAQHRDDLGGLVYEDTAADPIDGTSWVALQPWSDGHGYLFAFRQGGGPDSTAIALHGVDAGRNYRLTDVRTGADLGTVAGSALANGLPITLAPFQAQVIAVQPA